MINYHTYSDKDLLSLLMEEKPVRDFAFYAIYKRYSPEINSYCQFITRNMKESESICHRAWILYGSEPTSCEPEYME